jgi:hypothetical protein
MTQRNERDQKTPTPTEVPTEKHEQGHKLGDKGGRQMQQGGQKNEGEGNRTAARQYNSHVQHSAENPAEVRREAEAARRAFDGPEGHELKKAEDAGRKPARR